MTPTAIRKLGASDLAHSISRGEVTSEAAVAASLDVITARNGVLNAFIAVDADEARAKARAADATRAKGGTLGPLHGVPIAVKDMFWMAGKVMTGGSELLADFRPKESATTIRRLEAAGAIIVGRLNMSEFAASPTGTNKKYGFARNAWDTSRIPGGSSSGSATAVAAHLVAGALGSDTGGSIRIPASMQGLVGLKPTQGRVSLHGTLQRAFSLDTVGPLTRHARDAALMFSVIAGADPLDPSALANTAPVAALPMLDPSRITIAVATAESLADTAPSIVEAVERTASGLRGLGFKLRPIVLPDFTQHHALADLISKCESATLHRRWMTEQPDAYARLVYDRQLAGLVLPATRYIEALLIRGKLLEAFLADVLSDATALLLPTVAAETPTIAEIEPREVGAGSLAQIRAFTMHTRTFNYLGVPAVTMPAGVDRNRMPIGAQLVGRPLAEVALLAIVDAYERDVGFGLPEMVL